MLVRRRVTGFQLNPCLALLNDEAWISQVTFFWVNRSLLRIKVRIPQILKAFPTEDSLFEMSSGGEDGYFRTFALPVEPQRLHLLRNQSCWSLIQPVKGLGAILTPSHPLDPFERWIWTHEDPCLVGLQHICIRSCTGIDIWLGT